MKDEFEKIISSNACLNKLNGSTVMITGATGTIGSYMLDLLVYCNATHNADIKLICPVRNVQKAAEMYGAVKNLTFIKFDLCEELAFDFDVDYIVHCAGPTRSADMTQKPVDTINAVFSGTERLLRYFKDHGRKGFLYVSSVEIYGENFDSEKIFTEDTVGAVDTLNVRSSYPEAKRLAENLCTAYASEYGLPIKIARLSQILGVGQGDNRLIAYLCDCAKHDKPIVLKSDGKATKAYCYIADCVSAIVYILVDGDATAYNVANEGLVYSVYGLAEYVSRKYLDGSVTVENKSSAIYPKSSYLVLSAKKLRDLGWAPIFDLDHSFDRLVKGEKA